MKKHEFYWIFFERPKRMIKSFFSDLFKRDNAYLIQKEADKFRGEIMLDHFKTVRLLGWTDRIGDDYYWIIDTRENGIEFHSCCGGFTRLKGKLSKFEYYTLEHIWDINGHNYEETLELADFKGIIVK